MTNKENLQRIAKMVINIDHVGSQCDDIHHCEYKHQTILELDKLDRYVAVRLLISVIEAQQLSLCGAKIELDNENPFRDMIEFNFIDMHVECNSPDDKTLY